MYDNQILNSKYDCQFWAPFLCYFVDWERNELSLKLFYFFLSISLLLLIIIILKNLRKMILVFFYVKFSIINLQILQIARFKKNSYCQSVDQVEVRKRMLFCYIYRERNWMPFVISIIVTESNTQNIMQVFLFPKSWFFFSIYFTSCI